LALDAALEHARDLLADDRAHRAAHEAEEERAELERTAVEATAADQHRVVEARLLAGALDALGVAARVGEAEGIPSDEAGVVLLERAGAEEELHPRLAAQAAVVAALGADLVGLREVLGAQGDVARVALAKHAAPDRALLGRIHATSSFTEPRHGRSQRAIARSASRRKRRELWSSAPHADLDPVPIDAARLLRRPRRAQHPAQRALPPLHG